MDLTNIFVAVLVPIVTGVVGAVGILTRDLYDRRSEMGRRKYAMDDATRQVTFTAEWWKAKQALGSAPDDKAARAIAESWLEEATSLVSEALHPPRRPKPDRSVTSRILLAYPFQRWTARLLRGGLLSTSGIHGVCRVWCSGYDRFAGNQIWRGRVRYCWFTNLLRVAGIGYSGMGSLD
jgi:hypothetical protein